ncbi:MAG: tripartite tricarboxylate transporter substrate binding protein [Pseudomonadota bacterium]
MWKSISGALWLLACAGASLAQGLEGPGNVYPARPIRLIVPYAPGGSTDKVARLSAEYLGLKLKQAVVVENRPGANNLVGANTLLASAADGYTLMLASNGLLTMAPAVFRKLPFDPARDFSLVGMVNQNPMVIATSASGRYRDMRSVLAEAKARPDTVTYAVSGGFVPALAAASLQAMSGTKMVEVRYKGSALSLTDLIADRVALSFMGVSLAAPLAEDGKLRALAVTSKERSSKMPDVPTLRESGVAGFDMVVWNALIGPPHLPQNVIATLNRALGEVYRDAEFRKRLQANGEEPLHGTPAELQVRMDEEIALWKRVVKDAGIPKIDD